MSTINIDLAADTILNVMIGQQDENEVREVVFDFSGWYTTYGSGTISLAIQRPKDEWPYEGTLTVDSTNHKATWEISETDTAYAGTGQIQLSYKVGDAKKKSVVYRFTCHKSLGALGSVVTPVQIQTFIDEVEEALQTMDGKLDDMEDEITDVKADLANIPTGASVPANVRQAIYDLLNNNAFASTDANTLSNLAILESWADTTVTAITLNHSTLTFNSATTQQLTATLTPSDATDTVTWASSNTSVATVSNSGLVTAVGNGSATITASVGSVSAQCSVSVSGVLSTFTITNNLTHVTNSNNATVATENSSYTATLTAESGYTLGNVTITMGETDITSTAYDNGSISIASVTGNIVITASIQASNMDGWTDGIAYTDLTVVKNEYCEKATGNFKSYIGWDRTGYVPCNGATSITFPAASSMSAITSDSNWFFTENHTGIQYFGLEKAGNTVTVPSNAYYFVISETSACVEQLIQAGIVPNA